MTLSKHSHDVTINLLVVWSLKLGAFCDHIEVDLQSSSILQPRDTRYLLLDDGRKLCLECLDSAIMDTHECQPLYLEIQEFYEGLNMKVEQQVPMLLVERQALNEAMEGEKNVITFAFEFFGSNYMFPC